MSGEQRTPPRTRSRKGKVSTPDYSVDPDKLARELRKKQDSATGSSTSQPSSYRAVSESAETSLLSTKKEEESEIESALSDEDVFLTTSRPVRTRSPSRSPSIKSCSPTRLSYHFSSFTAKTTSTMSTSITLLGSTFASLRQQLLRIKTAIDNHDQTPPNPPLSKFAVEIYLQQCISMATTINNYGRDIHSLLDGSTTPSLAEGETNYSDMDNELMDLRVRLMEIQKGLAPVTGTGLKPPKITLPKFSGIHTQWTTFRDSITSLIINEAKFSPSEKMRLLLDCLEGQARETISDLSISDVNYPIAWARMKSRYDSDREICHMSIQPLIDLPPLKEQSESGLYKVVNTVRTVQEHLKHVQLGTVTMEEALFLHFTLSKLDKKTLDDFNRTLTNTKVPHLQTCLDFLERRAKEVGLNSTLGKSQGPKLQKNEKGQYEYKRVLLAQQHPNVKGGKPNAQRRQEQKTRKQGREAESSTKPQGKPVAAEKGKKFAKWSCYYCTAAHGLYNCTAYTRLKVRDRIRWVDQQGRCRNCIGLHGTNQCEAKTRCCVCSGKHHATLHMDAPPQTPVNCLSNTKTSNEEEEMSLLATAWVPVQRSNATPIQLRALLDQGSQISFITAKAVKKLRIPMQKGATQFEVCGAGALTAIGKIKLCLISTQTPNTTLEIMAFVLKTVTSNLPSRYFETSHWDHLDNLPLADEYFNSPGPIDVLLSASVCDQIMLDHTIRKSGYPSARLTEFGYVLNGALTQQAADPGSVSMNIPNVARFTSVVCPSEILPFDMEKFWIIDSIPLTRYFTPVEMFCQEHYEKHVSRLPDGRYQVRLPLMENPQTLGDSQSAAIRRLFSIEKILAKNKDVAFEYHQQLQSYLDKGQMEEVLPEELHKTCYYMPHHPVFKPNSLTTKLRVVFDASAHGAGLKSLNGILGNGPVIQRPLVDQITNFRLRSIAVGADISTMYREIAVHPEDTDLQRIVWRKNPSTPIRHFRLKCVVFGQTPAPWLAVRTLQQIAEDEQLRYPVGCNIIKKCFYVDDLMSSFNTVSTAIHSSKEVQAALASAGMTLHKWVSNSNEFLASIPPEQRATQLPMSLDDSDTVQTLGLYWHPKTDVFSFTVDPSLCDIKNSWSKRDILSAISKIYDPLGFLAPVIILAKSFMQELWKVKLEWDDGPAVIPETLYTWWLSYIADLPSLQDLQISRSLHYDEALQWELHGFCDASETAYSAVFYLRGVDCSTQKVYITFLCSKTRVAPIKKLTIPRLELQAACLLTSLLEHVQENWDVKVDATRLWTDSTISLNWIHSSPSRWKTYISNRVQHIQNKSAVDMWAHVRSEDNPADCASRGILPSELSNHPLWWQGPTYLQDPNYSFPTFNPTTCCNEIMSIESKPEKKALHIRCNDKPVVFLKPTDSSFLYHPLFARSTWPRAVKIIAMIKAILKRKTFCSNAHFHGYGPYLPLAEITICRWIQLDSFLHPRKGKRNTIPSNLAPFPDEDGVQRVGGRLENSNLPYDARHPIILPGYHHIVRTLIVHTHEQLCHAPKTTIHAHLMQKYWILNATPVIKSVIHHCLTCHRYKAQPETQLMGQLPANRITIPGRAFLHSSVDFAGPYTIRNNGRKGHYKCWIALFACQASRAIHLELVTALTTEAFMLALKRFIARRGKPIEITSDNGTNFVGANNYLQRISHKQHRKTNDANLQILTSTDSHLTSIKWKFNPPNAPHHGGSFEICVKLVKEYLKRTLEGDIYTYEEFYTILVYVESLVNSRPLMPLTNDPEDLDVLTPAHFLVGSSLTGIAEEDLRFTKLNRLNKYQLVTRRMQDLWTRWQVEYVTNLTKRTKWHKTQRNLQIGDLVLIMEDNEQPLQWKTGRVTQVHPGKDALVRVCTIETNATYKEKGKAKKLVKTSTEVKRAISKLALLPLESQKEEEEEQEKDMTERGENRFHKPNPTTSTTAAALSLLNCIPTTQAKDEHSFPSPFSFSILPILAILLLLLCCIHSKKIRRVNNFVLQSLCVLCTLFQTVASEHMHYISPNLTLFAPTCTSDWPPHHIVKSCTSNASWLHVLKNGTVCSRYVTCSTGQTIFPDAMGCHRFFGVSDW